MAWRVDYFHSQVREVPRCGFAMTHVTGLPQGCMPDLVSPALSSPLYIGHRSILAFKALLGHCPAKATLAPDTTNAAAIDNGKKYLIWESPHAPNKDLSSYVNLRFESNQLDA
jgi:hypothetical protein